MVKCRSCVVLRCPQDVSAAVCLMEARWCSGFDAAFLNDDSVRNDTYCAGTAARLVTDHWLFSACRRVCYVKPSNSYN